MTLPGHVIAGAYPAYPCPRREVKTQGRLHQPRHLINALPSARIVNYPALGQAAGAPDGVSIPMLILRSNQDQPRAATRSTANRLKASRSFSLNPSSAAAMIDSTRSVA